MNPREELRKRFDAYDCPDIELPSFESIKIKTLANESSRNTRHYIFYARRSRGISYASLDKKAKIVRKFMKFLIDPIVAKQNAIDGNLTTVLEEYVRLQKEKDELLLKEGELLMRIERLESVR